MDLSFSVWAIIAAPCHDVFEAVADPAKLSQYFTTGGAEGRLQTGRTVAWDFADFPGAFPVDVIVAEQDERIVLRWAANEGPPADGQSTPGADYQTEVVFLFEPVGDNRTKVSIGESGWRQTPDALKASYGNCMGWSQMLCCLKAYLEYGINLRQGMY